MSESPDLEGQIKALSIDLIQVDDRTQMREQLNDEAIQSYSEKWSAGVTFDAVDVFFDGSETWLADGFHRFEAAKRANRGSIPARIHLGTLRDAVLFAAGANDHHGVRLTRADKKRAVLKLLADKEWGGKSSNWIAEHCHVSCNTVEVYRRELASTSQLHSSGESLDPQRLGKDGKSRRVPQRTGQHAPTAAPVPQTGSMTKNPLTKQAAVIDDLFGKLIRAVDEFKGLTGDQHSYDEVHDALNMAFRDFEAWRGKAKKAAKAKA